MEWQQLYLEYRNMTEQAKKIHEFLQQASNSIAEVSGLIDAMDDFATLDKGTRLFAPIANGIFLEGTLNTPGELRVNVGGNVLVKKSAAEARAMLERQRRDLEEMRDKAQAERTQLLARLQEIEGNIGE